MEKIWKTMNKILKLTGDMYAKETTRKELKKKIEEEEKEQR